MQDEARKRGVKLLLLQIPREVMEQQAVDKGDIRFFELAYLDLAINMGGRGSRRAGKAPAWEGEAPAEPARRRHGRARLPPSRQGADREGDAPAAPARRRHWEGEAPAEPARRRHGRARLPQSRQGATGRARLPPSPPPAWEGEAPAEPRAHGRARLPPSRRRRPGGRGSRRARRPWAGRGSRRAVAATLGGRGSRRAAATRAGRPRLVRRRPLGRARLPPSRRNPGPDDPASPVAATLGRARLPPSRRKQGRTTPPRRRRHIGEGEAPAEPARRRPGGRGSRRAGSAGASPSRSV
ncbi:MAG: hypothetical protein KatS3mg082_2018 [Nitrospiraceae bacterium]|nr:MAG: hypothetical protein KatS3mg082_2018 [Nitrospiraceae bacterium]